MPSRREWGPVAYWETMRTVKRKDFLFSVLVFPFLIIGIVFAIAWFKERGEKREFRLALVQVDASGARVETRLAPLKKFTWVAPVEHSLDDLKKAVDERRYDGAVLLPDDYAESGLIELIVRRGSPQWKRAFESHLREQARIERAAALGLDADALERVDAEVSSTEIITQRGGQTSRADRGVAVIMSMLLVMVLFGTVSFMMIGITGEKQARVTEVIVSAIRPQSWIDGKIIAYTAIGLVEAVLWGGMGLILLLLLRQPIPAGLTGGMLATSALLFVFGLLAYTALYAIIMATIKDLQSTSKLQAYLFMLPFIPLLFLDSMIHAPDGVTAMILSQIPFFSPFVLPTRLALGAVLWWEIPLALSILAVTAHYLRRGAGAAFRIGMLMYGKELTLPELARWAKKV